MTKPSKEEQIREAVRRVTEDRRAGPQPTAEDHLRLAKALRRIRPAPGKSKRPA